MSRKAWLNAFSYAFTALVLVYVYQVTDWQQVTTSVMGGDWRWFMLGFLVFLVNYGLRAWRFRILLQGRRFRTSDLVAVTGLYGMFNYLMPAKSGELSFLYLVRVYLATPLSSGAATLIAARFFDFATVSLFLPGVMFVFGDRIPSSILMGVTLFCAAMWLIGAAAAWHLRRVELATAPPESVGRAGKLEWVARRLRWELAAISQRGNYQALWLLSTLIWLCVYSYFYCIVVGLGVDVTLWHMVVISLLLIPLTLFPIQGVANIGTHEIAWVTAFSLFGMTHAAALSTAIASHALLLVFVLLTGLLSWSVLWGNKILGRRP